MYFQGSSKRYLEGKLYRATLQRDLKHYLNGKLYRAILHENLLVNEVEIDLFVLKQLLSISVKKEVVTFEASLYLFFFIYISSNIVLLLFFIYTYQS